MRRGMRRQLAGHRSPALPSRACARPRPAVRSVIALHAPCAHDVPISFAAMAHACMHACTHACRDAEEASRRRDGVEFLGARLRCEVAKGGDARANHRPVSARSTGYRVLIKGLPRSASWQDLKVQQGLGCGRARKCPCRSARKACIR